MEMQQFVPDIKDTPIPLEITLFSDEAKHEPNTNIFEFTFPEEWSTSNMGERIIGIRSIYETKIRRKLEYTFGLQKYKLDEKGEPIEESNNNIVLDITSWLPVEKDLREIFSDLSHYLTLSIKKQNEELDEIGDKVKARFRMDDDPFARDFQMDGGKDKDPLTQRVSFTEHFYCPNNVADEVCRFAIYDLNKDARAIFNVKDPNNPNDKNRNEEVSGISPVREIKWYDVWDRHSSKVLASFSHSVNKYIGNTKLLFNPIKYFKLNSTDRGFTIEIYNGRDYKLPTILPNDNKEGFYIDMVFLQYDKLLYS